MQTEMVDMINQLIQLLVNSKNAGLKTVSKRLTEESTELHEVTAIRFNVPKNDDLIRYL